MYKAFENDKNCVKKRTKEYKLTQITNALAGKSNRNGV